jgi:hypothetical protein
MGEKKLKPSTYIENFLNLVDTARSQHQIAFNIVGEEDKRLQDLLHDLELAKGQSEKSKASTRLRKSRLNRRINKDITLEYEDIVNFFNDPVNQKVLNQLRQLLGKQRKTESYLSSQRTYKPRRENKNVV